MQPGCLSRSDISDAYKADFVRLNLAHELCTYCPRPPQAFAVRMPLSKLVSFKASIGGRNGTRFWPYVLTDGWIRCIAASRAGDSSLR